MAALMRTAAVHAFGPPEALVPTRLPIPDITADEILVQVRTAGVQPADAGVRQGWSPPGAPSPSFPLVPGNECAGTVVAAGDAVQRFAVGDDVIGFRMLGCYADFAAIRADQAVKKPAALTWEVAGVLSASAQTADTAIEDLAIRADDTVIVHGAAGGVGTVFTQLARRRGATVIGVASETNHRYLHELGAIPAAYGAGLIDRIRNIAPRGVDAVLDAAGHDSLHVAVEVANDLTRVATIADPDLADELGVAMLRSRRSAERLQRLAQLAVSAELQIHVRRSFPLERAVDAHRELETGHGRGKMVLAL